MELVLMPRSLGLRKARFSTWDKSHMVDGVAEKNSKYIV